MKLDSDLWRDMIGASMARHWRQKLLNKSDKNRSLVAGIISELSPDGRRGPNHGGVIVVTRNLGLTVAQSTDLRNRMRDAGAKYKVAKNRLALIALEGTLYQPIGDLLSGLSALATASDPVAAAKAAVDFAETNDRFEIVGGAIGEKILSADEVRTLANLPTLDTIRAILIRQMIAQSGKLDQQVSPSAAFSRLERSSVEVFASVPAVVAARWSLGFGLASLALAVAYLILGWFGPEAYLVGDDAGRIGATLSLGCLVASILLAKVLVSLDRPDTEWTVQSPNG